MKLGFIGCGNMANAMIAGIIGNGICKAEEIIGTAKSEASRVRVKQRIWNLYDRGQQRSQEQM